jgi:penicillin amidase
MLFGGDLLDVEDMAGIQADTYSAAAEALRPHLLAIEPESSLHAEALDHVRGWDLRVDTESVGASILETWLHFLMRNTLGDECGDLVENHDLNTEDHVHQTLMMIDLLADDDNAWFDNVRTPRVETRDEIVRRSLVEALDWLCERLGENPAEWEWGRLHQATFRHELGWDVDLRSIVGDETLARIVSSNSLARTANTAIERALNSEPVPVPGDLFSVNAAGYRGAGKQPFEVYYGAVVRMIVDVSDWDNAQAVLVPGQSGHILHPHQEDQIALWQNVDYRPMPFSREAVERNAGSRLTIKPRQ